MDHKLTLYSTLFFLLVFIFSMRTGLYAVRTVKEFITPARMHVPQIKACSPQNFQNDEERMIYNYRTLGMICEK